MEGLVVCRWHVHVRVTEPGHGLDRVAGRRLWAGTEVAYLSASLDVGVARLTRTDAAACRVLEVEEREKRGHDRSKKGSPDVAFAVAAVGAEAIA